MSKCPNCSYKLVLLPNRLKYKCALCSRLYPQRQVDNKEFRNLNKKQKITDIENYKRERKEELTKIKEIKRNLKLLFNGFPKKHRKEYYEENKERIKQRNKEWRLRNIEYNDNRMEQYYLKNREKILLKIKIKRQNDPELYNQKRKEWRNKNIEVTRIHYLIRAYRRKQKALALLYLKNNQYSPSNANIFHSVPTYALSYLLKE